MRTQKETSAAIADAIMEINRNKIGLCGRKLTRYIKLVCLKHKVPIKHIRRVGKF